MTRQLIVTALAAALATTLLAACQKQEAPTSTTPSTSTAAAPASGATTAAAPKAAPVDYNLLSDRLVANAAVKEGEVVMIVGRAHDAELMEDIAVAARKLGAFPMILYSSDRLAKRMFFDVPEKWDSQRDTLDADLADVVDVIISLGNNTTENLFEGADPKRMAARGKANEGIGELYQRKGVRNLEVGNNLYPTPWRAQRFGMSEDELSKIFWNGVNVDYADLVKRGATVKGALAAGSEVHITHPNGTDLTVNIKGRPVGVSDGVISAEDMQAGGAANAVYLPAGEVYVTPVSGTANGKLVNSRAFYRGQQIDNLTMTFKDGKMTGMSGAGPGFAPMKAEYDAIDDARKDDFSYVDLGINPNITLPANSTVGNWVPAGTITVGTGGNTWAGGNNTVPYGQTVSLSGSTVTLDGKPIIEGGSLKL
ncbi:Leucyl aminopeptidase [Lysobacter dokdonensis DS-58]|uniref:Leucyl aminopeptidase n=1 Tax=Lysobacter dokdonensis DS-58 TaxID=1300345 RepID=A0A0A2WYP6_9GAMM|nr:aminopeptidase [Lysobacter dokdonensis]KGQ18104.1 Leucyl aminopeptidase [Lysobacter dokdonensis DS-58]